MNKNTHETTMEESAPAGLGFSLPPDETIRLACSMLSFFPWAESELAARMAPAFLAAALGGVKAANTSRALMLHITGGDKRARAAMCQYVSLTLADSPAVLAVKTGTDTAGIAAALRSAPAARLLILEDAEPARGSLRYLREMAPDVAVLAFSQKTFADAGGGLAVGAVELRLRSYIDKTEEKTLEEWRTLSIFHAFRLVKAREAADALRHIDTAAAARVDVAAQEVENMIRKTRRILEDALCGMIPTVNGTAAALRHKGEAVLAHSGAPDDKIKGALSYLVSGATTSRCEPQLAAVLATLYACRPCPDGANVTRWRREYEASML